MDKQECVIEYAKKQILVDLSTLSFPLIKTTEQFLSNYRMHDIACRYVILKYIQSGFLLAPIGVDERGRRVIVRNSLPDYLAIRGDEVFCFDVKSKSRVENFGWVNERDALSYRELVRVCKVPVFLNFVRIVDGQVRELGYCNIEDEPLYMTQAWDGNIVWVYRWEVGLARI